LQELYEESVETNWAKALDFVVYAGFLGDAGLINNPNVAGYTVAAGGSGSTRWSQKQPQEILADINNALNQTVQNSGYEAAEGMADHLLIPYTQFAYLTAPMTIGGTSVTTSIIKYVEENCVAAHHGVKFKIDFLPNPWISGQGIGNTSAVGVQGNGLDRAVFYKNSKKALYLKVPQPMQQAMTVPTTRRGGAFETLYAGCISQVIFKRTTTTIYGDGI
jgi:hypothetical protein